MLEITISRVDPVRENDDPLSKVKGVNVSYLVQGGRRNTVFVQGEAPTETEIENAIRAFENSFGALVGRTLTL